MSLEKTLASVKALVDQELRGFFQKKQVEARRIHPEVLTLVGQVASLTLRAGKRTRAFLCWLGYQTVQRKKISKELLSAMLGLELLQTFALIHDDLIDQDRQRRGGPTVHRYFADKGQMAKDKCKDPEHFGESLAILTGDLALTWADGLMQQANNPTVSDLYHLMKEQTIYGQQLDVLREQAGKEIDKARVSELKTAYYSVVRPLALGATLAGANQKLLQRLESYGLMVGRAFQLRDDFLDKELNAPDFGQQIKPLLNQALRLSEKLSTSESVKRVYRDFARFVVRRET